MDRISNLPDEILYKILSFHSTKESALTSLLAKRWRNLFAFSSTLCFENENENREQLLFGNFSLNISTSFSAFVDRVFSVSNDSQVKKFTLKCVEGAESSHINPWIRNVLKRGVMDLVLCITSTGTHRYRHRPLPIEVFTCKTLVKLSLGTRFEIAMLPESASLPALKTLFLDRVLFSNPKNSIFENLLSACPVLEELYILDVISLDWAVNISSASLKTLTIESNKGYTPFSFDTPSLAYFCYYGYVAKEDFSGVKMDNLLEARILLLVPETLNIYALPYYNEEGSHLYNKVGKLMNGIRNVQYLHLSPYTLEVLDLCCESIPVFNNLKSLAIRSDPLRGWQAMPVLLRNCPCLETLTIEGLLHYVTDKCGDACNCVSREEKGRSLTSCPVKMLKIQRFRGSMKEMHMIKHFLEYFPSLKEMEIYIEKTDPIVSATVLEMFEVYNKLSSCNVLLHK